MRFEKPLVLYYEGIGDIIYNSPNNGGTPTPPFVPLASNGVFYDAADQNFKWGTGFGGTGVPFTIDRRVDFGSHKMHFVDAQLVFDNPVQNTIIYKLNVPGVNIEQVFTQSVNDPVPFERQVNTVADGPPDDNVYIQGWNIDSDFDGTSPSWTWRLEYKFDGDLYENHLQFSDPIAGTTYRLFSTTFTDHGAYGSDICLIFFTSNAMEFRQLDASGFPYASWQRNPIGDSGTFDMLTQGGLQIQYAIQNGSGLTITSSGFGGATFLMNGFGGGIGFGAQSPGGNNCAALGTTLWVNNFITTQGADPTLFTFDNQNNDLFFSYLPHLRTKSNWHEHFSNATGNWEFGFRNLGGYNIQFGAYDDTWTLTQLILQLAPAFANFSVNVNIAGVTGFAASTVALPSIVIPDGATPAAPAEGWIWSDGANLKMVIGGVTKTFTLV